MHSLGKPSGYTVSVVKNSTMKNGGNSSTLVDMLCQRCPRCRRGNIFRYSIYRGFPRMCELCAICGLKFQREEGYFLGAMYISFGLALVVIALIWAVLIFLPLAPAISLFARVLWIYLDQTFDPEPPSLKS